MTTEVEAPADIEKVLVEEALVEEITEVVEVVVNVTIAAAVVEADVIPGPAEEVAITEIPATVILKKDINPASNI